MSGKEMRLKEGRGFHVDTNGKENEKSVVEAVGNSRVWASDFIIIVKNGWWC